MKGYIVSFLVVVAVAVLMAWMDHRERSHGATGVVVFDSRDARCEGYQDGFNSALDAVMLLNLEQQLTGTNRTYREMFEIIRKRYGVPAPTWWTNLPAMPSNQP